MTQQGSSRARRYGTTRMTNAPESRRRGRGFFRSSVCITAALLWLSGCGDGTSQSGDDAENTKPREQGGIDPDEGATSDGSDPDDPDDRNDKASPPEDDGERAVLANGFLEGLPRSTWQPIKLNASALALKELDSRALCERIVTHLVDCGLYEDVPPICAVTLPIVSDLE